MIFPAANAVSICLFISATKAVIRADFLSPAIVASVSPALRREVKVSSQIPRVEVMTESSALRLASLTDLEAAFIPSEALTIASACD